MDTRYNGFSNYPTWRISLEIFDGLDLKDVVDSADEITAEWVNDYVDYIVFETAGNPTGLVADYAKGFLSSVNYWEIASLLKENYNE